LETVIVLDESEFLEFIHEEIDSGARGPHHFRQSFLRHFCDHFLRLVFLAVVSEKKSACQPFFAGAKKLIDQILLDSDIPRKDVGQEAARKRMLRLEHANHLRFFNDEQGCGCDSGRRSHAEILSGQTCLAKKVARGKNCHDGFFAGLVDNGQLYFAILNVVDILSRIALRINLLRVGVLQNSSRHASRIEKLLGIERVLWLDFPLDLTLLDLAIAVIDSVWD